MDKNRKKLSEWGIVPKKAHKVVFPPQLNSQYYNSFIRGHFDGDGCFYFNKKRQNIIWSIVGTKSLLMSIKNILKDNLDVNSCLSRKTGCNSYELIVSGNLKVAKIINYMYNDATIWMKRKRKKYLDSIEYIKQNNPVKYQNLMSVLF